MPTIPSLQVQEALAGATEVAMETFQAMATIRSFAHEAGAAERYHQRLRHVYRLEGKDAVTYAATLWASGFSALGLKLGLLCYGGQLVATGTITTGDLVTFLIYQIQFTEAVEVLLCYYPNMTKAVGSSEKIFEFLDQEEQVAPAGTLVPDVLQGHLQLEDVWFSYPEHQEPALVFGHGDLLSKAAAGGKVLKYLDQEPTGDAGGTRAPATLRGHVAFQRVSFAYPTRPDHLVLQDVSFELRPGEVMALAGLNGSGKSTCAALLERFYEPDAGEVLLDGVALRDYEHQYLHRQVVLVGQEPVLFSGTIRDNIVFGLEGCGEEEVTAAAAAAGALGFISALDRGFDTDVGEKGGQLSAGEKQRIAIARALVRRPTVLILDEATSALDGEGEAALQQWVRSGGTRTVLLITHCPRMLEAADRVVVLERGAVVEMGTPAQLRSRHGPYSRLLQRSPGAGQQETPGMGCGEQGPAPAPGAAPVEQEIFGASRAGRVVLLVTGKVALAARAQRVAVLEGGRLHELESPEELLRPGSRYWQLLQGGGQGGTTGDGDTGKEGEGQ
ncbi:antigen peptide transporter 2 [Limosa lapponica baueri]|uniref:Antigen peptide transporter 2 n=1 Tax=Limosa lapponica baueri TaxID=1758121 RepID=A0A2I0T5K3_LIMLA|nr:antigen peptide transporter 2 [Limosa lapponica baueri]